MKLQYKYAMSLCSLFTNAIHFMFSNLISFVMVYTRDYQLRFAPLSNGQNTSVYDAYLAWVHDHYVVSHVFYLLKYNFNSPKSDEYNWS
jgi:hypothetical protein